jgi:hypothetical protein
LSVHIDFSMLMVSAGRAVPMPPGKLRLNSMITSNSGGAAAAVLVAAFARRPPPMIASRSGAMAVLVRTRRMLPTSAVWLVVSPEDFLRAMWNCSPQRYPLERVSQISSRFGLSLKPKANIALPKSR